MTVRFDTWVEADTPKEAWEKLRLALEDKRMGDKLKNEFTVTILEDPDEDKARMKGELTVREVKDFCLSMENVDCDECPLRCKDDYCTIYSDMPLNWDIKEITKLVRGYKPEGEER